MIYFFSNFVYDNFKFIFKIDRKCFFKLFFAPKISQFQYFLGLFGRSAPCTRVIFAAIAIDFGEKSPFQCKVPIPPNKTENVWLKKLEKYQRILNFYLNFFWKLEIGKFTNFLWSFWNGKRKYFAVIKKLLKIFDGKDKNFGGKSTEFKE